MNSKKAVALMSGGLDSLLAAKIILDQDIEVVGLYFFMGFSPNPHTYGYEQNPRRDQLKKVSELLGIPIHTLDVTDDYRSVVFNPRYGFGSKKVNPCLDCKIFMLTQALRWMKQNNFDFIITGEILGQRPMTQRRDTLGLVMKNSGVGDLLLRPLCAQHMPPTMPEREGWVDREKLLGISGRSRSEQVTLAKSYGWEDFPKPAGDCCFLIDENFARRFLDYKQYENNPIYTVSDIALLKVGRHVRLGDRAKIIAGRDEKENMFLDQHYAKYYIVLEPMNAMGPNLLLTGKPLEEDILLAASVLGRWVHTKNIDQLEVEVRFPRGEKRLISVKPAHSIPEDWYI